VWQVRQPGMGLGRCVAWTGSDSHGLRLRQLVRLRVLGLATWFSRLVPSGKKAGTHIGKVAVRASGSFNVSTTVGVVQGISHKHCSVLHRRNGYLYLLKQALLSAFEKTESPRPGDFMNLDIMILLAERRSTDSI